MSFQLGLSPKFLQKRARAIPNDKRSVEGQVYFDLCFSERKIGMASTLIDLVRELPSDRTLVIDSFYPYANTTQNLKEKGLGALFLALITSELSQRKLLTPEHRVYYSPKVSSQFRGFAKRLEIEVEGMTMPQYCNRLFGYCNQKGFTLTNPFPEINQGLSK